MNSMEQTSKTFSRSCQNKNSGKGAIITYIQSFQQTMLMSTIDTHNVSKENNLKSHYLVLVRFSAEKSASKLFGVLNLSIREIRF